MRQNGFVNILMVLVVMVLLGAGTYFIWNKETASPVTPTPTPTPVTPAPTPVPAPTPSPIGNAILEKLGQQFTLQKGQVAKITDAGGLEIKITQFYNSPCPAGAQCFWSGVGVAFEARLGKDVQKGMDAIDAFGFHISTSQTDFETYANFLVERMVR